MMMIPEQIPSILCEVGLSAHKAELAIGRKRGGGNMIWRSGRGGGMT